MTNEPDIPARPERAAEAPLPPFPDVSGTEDANSGSVRLSQQRTHLSRHRTRLSEHRTQLSEHRTDLSRYRTDLSTRRTSMSTQRTEMSMRRTGMSFQRTRMSADRTLMSVMRTALSLIGFGFTIFQFFQKMQDAKVLTGVHAPRNFGITLVAVGIGMLVLGIVYHLQFMVGLRKTREAMKLEHLIHGESVFPPSLVLVTALVLLAIGIWAVVSMVR
jgi:uncharacterized membrane protein YidH (DUF202 family)